MTIRVRRGMTLMELVVGVTITGIMAAAGSAAFGSIIDHRRIIRESTVSTERAAALRDMLRTWIASGTIQIQQGGVPRGLQSSRATVSQSLATAARGGSNSGAVSAAQASGDELTFTTTAENPSMLPNVRIRLYIDADASTPETGLTMEYQPNAQMPLVRKSLEPAVGILKVELLDRRTGRWFAMSEGATITPRAVRLTLQPPEHGSIPPLLGVPMIFIIGQQNQAQNAGASR